MKRAILFVLLLLYYFHSNAQIRICPTNVPLFTANLAGNPDSVWTSPSQSRSNLCCGNSNPDRCVEFIVTLDNDAQGIKFDIASGAIPPGAMFYQVNCGPQIQVGQPVCLNGPGPHNITFCKPGNNPNSYRITSIAKPKVSPPTVVSDGCNGTIFASDYVVSSIVWRSVPNNPVFDSYLSALSGVDTVQVNFAPGAPAFVDYEVCGTPIGGCIGTIVCDTVRVQFVNTLAADIQPKNATICFGSVGTTLTANGVGGLAPYTYLWNTGATTQSITAATAGTYSVIIDDGTSCPIAFDTVIVTDFPSAIIADAGPDRIECNSSSPFAIPLNGSVQAATGGIWSSTGTGSFSPNNSTLNANYLPSPAELAAGSVLLTLTTTGNGTCPADTDQVFIRISNAAIVNAGNPQTVCANNPNVSLNGTVSGITTTGTWTTNGTGSFLPNANTLNATYVPSQADINSGSVLLTLTSTNNGICNPVASTVTITINPTPIVNAGNNTNVCTNNPNVNLNGLVSGIVTNTGTWSSSGNGIFLPNTNTLNAVYIPSQSDLNLGSVQLILNATNIGNCSAVSDTINITFGPIPIVNAGADVVRCRNNIGTIGLNANITGGASAGIWTTNGTGTFSPNNTTLNANYIPSQADILNGNVQLILSTTNHASNGCLIVRDTLQIQFTPAPIVNAGADQTVCANNININLNGTISGGASTGFWSSNGTGNFLPNSSSLNATYVPSAAEISSGNPIRIILSSTGNSAGSCLAVSDTMFVNITPAPIVQAVADFTICSTNPVISLSATISGGATTGIWTSNGSGVFNNPSLLNPTYTPSSTDITNGSVQFVLSSTGNTNNSCAIVRDTVTVTIVPLATVTANQTVITRCRNNIGTINVSANFTGAATGISWSTTGTGSFANPGLASTNYVPSNADINSNTSIFLIATSSGNASGLCAPIADTIVLNFTPAPIVSAGANINVCANNIGSGVVLNGSISGGASTGIWSSNGSGTFNNPNLLNAIYTPSASDISNGIVTLKLRTSNHGVSSCGPDSSFVSIIINPAPIVDAGANQTICANTNTNIILLGGTVSAGANTGVWSTTGNGTISNPNNLNTSYTLVNADRSLSNIKFYLTSTGNSAGSCLAVIDSFTLTISPAPIVNAGPNQTVCANNAIVNLSATVSGGASTGEWSTFNGTGVFSNPNALITTYTPSASDRTNGTVSLVFSSTGNTGGLCQTVRDTVVITITPSPVVNALADFSVCVNNPIINLSASLLQGPSNVTWTTSNGSGSFSNPNGLSTQYIVDPSDLLLPNLTFTITANKNLCNPVQDQVIVTFTPAPVVNITTADFTMCKNNISPIALNATVTGGATTGIWSSNGSGFFSPNNTTLNAQYILGPSDTSLSALKLFLTSTGNTSATCLAVRDSLTITFNQSPRVFAGVNRTICANNIAGVSLSTATIGGSAISSIWSSDGTGSFSPNANTLNATYNPSAADITKGFVVITLTSISNPSNNCNEVNSQFTLTISAAPIVEAGINQTVCSNVNTIALNGSVTGGASTGNWTTNGDGSFSPSSSALNATYTLGPNDIINGTVKLFLGSTGNSGNTCLVVSDSLSITILPSAISNAGLDQPICKITPSIQLNGSVSGSTTTGVWSTTGTGTFVPNASTLNATYIISPTDTNLSSILFVLNSTNNGACLGSSDTMIVTFSESDDASFTYTSATYCTSDPNAHIPVIPILATGSSGVFSSSPAGLNLNTSTGEITVSGSALGSYQVKFITNGPCPDSSIATVHIINNTPNASFTLPEVFCKGGTTLNPVFAPGATPGIFTANSSNLQFINANTGEIDLYNSTPGTYIITNTIPASGTCIGVSDSELITIERWVVLDLNPTLRTVCENNPDINLQANFTAGSNPAVNSGTWITLGDGIFSNISANGTSATYSPGANDLLTKTVTVQFISATPAGVCDPDSASIVINITPAPIVNAGNPDTICAAATSIPLNGTINGGATTGTWTREGGAGVFVPNANTLNANYFISAQDRINGSVKLYLTSTGNTNNTCNAVVDSVIFDLLLDPVINAGADTVVCFESDTIQLNASITGSITTGVWVSSGTGTFLPNSTSTNARYVLSNADKLNGSVQLALNSSAATSICSFVSDTLVITINPDIVIDAGLTQTVCANNDTVILNPSITGTGNQTVWSTFGDGTFLDPLTNFNNRYVTGPNDKINGSVILQIKTINPGSCAQDSDFVQINITPAPIVNAGADFSACANNLIINLNASISGGATNGRWTTNGTGTFSPHDSSLTAVYIASNADESLGNLEFVLTTLDHTNNSCLVVSDTLTVTITASPIVSILQADTLCINNIVPAQLNASISQGASTGKWSSISGDGTFAPNDSVLNPTYTPGPNDIANGSVQIVLTSTGNTSGTCIAVSDTTEILIEAAPSINIGVDRELCVGDTIILNASISNTATGIQWFSTGTGNFEPSNTVINPVYRPSPADYALSDFIIYGSTVNNSNCINVNDSINIDLIPVPNVNAGASQQVCADVDSIFLNGAVTGPTTTGIWSSNGTGFFSPNASTLNAKYIPSLLDRTLSTIVVQLSSTGGPSQCAQRFDTLSIHINPDIIVDASAASSVCENNSLITLTGLVSGSSTTGIWKSSGNGLFGSALTNLNNTYTPSASDITNGSITFTLLSSNILNCKQDSDVVQVSILPSPIVEAGSNQSICANINQASLSGSITSGATRGRWTSTGDGSFLPNDSSLNAIYIFGPNDITSSNLTLYLNSTDNSNGLCLSVVDSVVISVLPTVAISMIDTVQVCANNAAVNLNPTFSNAIPTSILWTTNGSGTFLPNNTTSNATYLPSVNDTTIGRVTLTLNTGNAGGCLSTIDSTILIISPAPIVNAGNTLTACVNKDTVNLNAQIFSNEGTGLWSSIGGGQFIPNNNNLNAQYILSPQDISNGFAQIILTSTGNTNNSCIAVSDTITVNINPAPILTITQDTIIVCENNANVLLSANISSSASKGIWITSGSGNFTPSDTVLNPTYVPSINDINATQVSLYFISTDHQNFNCNPVIDSVIVQITPMPLIVTEDTVFACISNTSVAIESSISQGASTGQWISLGSGTFSPNSSDLITNYIPSAADKLSGSVQLVINSTGNTNNSCLAESDTVTIIFTPLIFVDAGDTIQVCKNNININLNGSISGGTNSGRWSSSGTGNFLPNDTTLNAIYVLSNTDTLLNELRLTLVSTNNGGCDSSVSVLVVELTPAPIIDAGPDISVCDNSGIVTLAGFISGGASTGIWTTTGTGNFIPNNTALNVVYEPSQADFTAGNISIRLSTSDHALNNCVGIFDELNVNLFESARVTGGPDRYVCYGDSVTALFANATGANPFRYLWSTGDTTQSITVRPGTYFVRIQDINDCIPQYDTIEVIGVDTIIQARAGNDSIICISTDTVQLNADVLGINAGHWEGDGIFLPDSTALNALYIPTATEKSNGSFRLILQPSTITGCTFIPDTVEYTFIQKPSPTLLGPSTVCLLNDTVTYSVTSIPGEFYTWQANGGTIIGPNNSNAVFVQWGAAGGTLTLIASNAANCDTIINTTITNVGMSLPSVSGEINVCNASAFNQSYTAALNAGSIYNWQITNGTILSGQNTNTVNVQWNGSGSLRLFETGNLGCVVSDTLNFSFTPLLVSTIQPFNEEGCAPLTLLFDANSANPGPLTHQWIINSSDTFNVKSAEITFDTPGVYNIRYVLNNGICTDTIATTVTVFDDPLADFNYINAPTSILYYPNDTLFLQNLSSITNAEYLWDFGDGETDTSMHPAHEYRNAGTFNVQLRVTDTVTGCISYFSRPITLEVISNVNSPQIFTPNGDGINDKFRIYERNLSNFKILIFDRWGQIIYTSKDPNFEWDGTHNGVECQVGAYVYHIVATGEDNLPYRRTDIVNLVK